MFTFYYHFKICSLILDEICFRNYHGLLPTRVIFLFLVLILLYYCIVLLLCWYYYIMIIIIVWFWMFPICVKLPTHVRNTQKLRKYNTSNRKMAEFPKYVLPTIKDKFWKGCKTNIPNKFLLISPKLIKILTSRYLLYTFEYVLRSIVSPSSGIFLFLVLHMCGF